jgi:hypothetical protein
MLINLRFRFPEVFFGALLAVAIFAMGMVFDPSLHPPSQQMAPTNAANQNQAGHIDGGFWNWLTHDVTGVFTLFLVVVGSLQIWVFLRQLRLIRDSLVPAQQAAEAAREAAEHIPIVERAYIYGGANYQGPIIDNRTQIESLLLKINNYGKTPAFIGTVAVTICSEGDLVRPITWQVQQWKGWVLGAPTPDMPTDVSLPFTKFGDVIIGRVWYRDIFNKCHSSGFVLRLSTNGLPAVGGEEHWKDRPEPDLGPAQP